MKLSAFFCTFLVTMVIVAQDSEMHDSTLSLKIHHPELGLYIEVSQGQRAVLKTTDGENYRGKLQLKDDSILLRNRFSDTTYSVRLNDVESMNVQSKKLKTTGVVLMSTGGTLVLTSVIILLINDSFEGVGASALVGLPGWAMLLVGTPVILGKRMNLSKSQGWKYRIE